MPRSPKRPNDHRVRLEWYLEGIYDQLVELNAKESTTMATLIEARDSILASIARTKTAILSAVTDLRAGAEVQAVADSLAAAAEELNAASGELEEADTTD